MQECTWEYDYVRYDLLSDFSNIDVEKINTSNIISLLDRQHLGQNMIVLTCRTDLDKILKIIEHIKPIIIFIMSDEQGKRTNWTTLQDHAKLVLRQYNHIHYKYKDNNIHLPLGYNRNYINKKDSNNISVRPIRDRIYNCSFIGEKKQDRGEMCEVFNAHVKKCNFQFVKTNWANALDQKYSPRQLFEIYNNSIFVLNGRGGTSLNCFRVYEAIIAGAIPIIVGDAEELKNTFTFHTGMPPCIFAESWIQATEICNNLLMNLNELQLKQDALIIWYRQTLLSIKLKINNVLKI